MFRPISIFCIIILSIVGFFSSQLESKSVIAANQEKSAHQFHSGTTATATGSSSSANFTHMGSFGQPGPVGSSTTSQFSMMAGYWPTYMGALSPVDISEKYKTVLHQNNPNPFWLVTQIGVLLNLTDVSSRLRPQIG